MWSSLGDVQVPAMKMDSELEPNLQEHLAFPVSKKLKKIENRTPTMTPATFADKAARLGSAGGRSPRGRVGDKRKRAPGQLRRAILGSVVKRS